MPNASGSPATVLAIDTSSKLGSVAVLSGNRLIAENSLDLGQQHAQSLVPGLRDLLAGCGLSLRDVTLVAVSIGPGSFTGLRVGVTAAKLLAYANAVPVLGVPTFLAIAAQAGLRQPDIAPPEYVTVIGDAQRQELFVQRFAVRGDQADDSPDVRSAGSVTATRMQTQIVEEVGPLSIHPVEQWLSGVTVNTGNAANDGDLDNHLVTGPALEQFGNLAPGELARRLQAAGVRVAAQTDWMPRAATIGRLAIAAAERGETSDLKSLEPLYGRRSSAEDKWDLRARNAV